MQLALARLEHVLDELARLAAERFVAGDEVAQLLLLVIAPCSCSSPPRSRTMRSVEPDTVQMSGRDSRAIRSSVGAAINATVSARCNATRLGVSSLMTSAR